MAIEDESRALLDTAALIESAEPAACRVIAVAGERAVAMVNGLVTNDLAPLANGRAVFALVLTPKGRPLAELRILPVGPGEIWLDTPPACADALLGHLRKYLPPLYATFEPRDDVGRLSVLGPRAAAALGAALARLGWRSPTDPQGLDPLQVAGLEPGAAESEGRSEAATGAGGGPDARREPAAALLVRREEPLGPGFDLYLPAARQGEARAALARAVAAEGGLEVGRAACEIWRVERGIPAYGVDYDLDNLPQETGLEARAISYDKGCYTGQEVVARIHYRGHVNRLLRGLRPLASGTSRSPASPPPGAAAEAGGAPPADTPPGAAAGVFAPGDALSHGGRRVGRISSAVRSPRFGPIGLGLVRREVEPGGRLEVFGRGELGPIEVVALPFTST